MPDTVPFDDIDRKIIGLLREDARRTVRDISKRVDLTVAPVRRRIDRLESTGVIEGYTGSIKPVWAPSWRRSLSCASPATWNSRRSCHSHRESPR